MAKTDRATEQLRSLHEEMKVFRADPNPYGYITTVDPIRGHYVFRLHPGWEANTAARWAVIIGEIVHDLRSALDHLVWHAVDLSGGKPDDQHAFPLLGREPSEGFAAWATRSAVTGRGRHGKLLGASSEAVALIETYQPYQGGAVGGVLRQLDLLWQCDKHRMTLPIVLVSAPPALELEGCTLLGREERMEDGALVVDVHIQPQVAKPKVELRSDAPFDIGFAGRPLIDDLLDAVVVVVEMSSRFEELFPDDEDLRHREARDALQRLTNRDVDK
jgi:hypothetical protein